MHCTQGCVFFLYTERGTVCTTQSCAPIRTSFLHSTELYIHSYRPDDRPSTSNLDLRLQFCNTGRLTITFFGARVMMTSYRGIEPALLVFNLFPPYGGPYVLMTPQYSAVLPVLGRRAAGQG